MAVGYKLVLSIGTANDRVLMACVDGKAFSGGNFYNCHPDGDKELFFVVLAKLRVDVFQNLSRAFTKKGAALNQSFGNDHKQSCRNSLTGYIGHNQANVVFVNEEEVIEVSSYLLCRFHCCKEVELLAGDILEVAREHACLDVVCSGKFTDNSLFFGRYIF